MTPCRTPLTQYLGNRKGWESIVLKDETKQVTGSFKYRSVFAKLKSVESDMELVTASTGNHGLALAATALLHKKQAHIYIPNGTPLNKINALQSYGADVVEVEGGYDDCVDTAKMWASNNGAVYVESFEDPAIVEGHRSVLREIEGDGVPFDTCIVPVGGGGLLASCLIHWRGSGKTVIGVEAECAPVMKRSLDEGRPLRLPVSRSIAEGIALPSVGTLPFNLCSAMRPSLVDVTEQEICQAICLLWKHNGIRAEGAGAAALAGALKISGEARTCLCIISGGNIDASQFDAIITAQMAT